MTATFSITIAAVLALQMTSSAKAPVTKPRLPQATVNLTMPARATSTCPSLTTGSDCIRNVPAGDARKFQNAINASTCGDTIILQAGSTYSGNFTIPATSCSGWILIESSALASLPASNNRVGPSNVPNMARVSTPNTSPAIAFLPNSNHWRLIGLEITTSHVSTSKTVYNIILSGYQSDDSTGVTSAAQLPSYIILDRSYLHGLSTTNATRGFAMDGRYVAVVDSYCDEIHYNANDSQCFNSTNGTGPWLIQNNFIQAAGENVMFGGSAPSIINLIPSDITIVGNLFQKNLTWQNKAAPYNWVVKNLFELKNAQRVLVDGNVFQYDWVAGQNHAIIIRAAGPPSWTSVLDVTITHNLIQHAPVAIALSPIVARSNPTVPTGRVLVQNNVMSDISCTSWGPGGQGVLFQLSVEPFPYIMHDIVIDHNTGFGDPNTSGSCVTSGMAYIGSDTGFSNHITNLQITNNISNYGVDGISGDSCGTGGTSAVCALSGYASGYIYNKNVFIDSTGRSPLSTWPAVTFWNTLSGVGFTSYSGTNPGLSGNFQLRSSSPYHHAGTDGNDIGVWDWATYNNDVTNALAGVWAPLAR